MLRMWRIARKELRESLRDRRTLVTLLLMPLLVYPLLGIVVQKFAVSRLAGQKDDAVVEMRVVLDPKIPEGLITRLLQDTPPQKLPQARDAFPDDQSVQEASAASAAVPGDGSASGPEARQPAGLPLLPDAAGANPPTFSADRVVLTCFAPPDDSVESLEQLVAKGRCEVALRLLLPVGFRLDSSEAATDEPADTAAPQERQRRGPVALEVISRDGDPLSQRAAEEVTRRVQFNTEIEMRVRLRRHGVEHRDIPMTESVTVMGVSARTAAALSTFVPLMLVLMTMTGAVYPAIDLTAGERERGTLEMLIAAPVSRRDILTGKYFAVCTIAVLTAIVNMIAMVATLFGTGFDKLVFGSDGLSLVTMLQVLLLLIVFASFFSSVLLTVTSFARSFKEAQAWLIPLMLVSLAPGIVSLLPNVELSPLLALVPLINIVLMARELFQGTPDLLSFVITLMATGLYTVLSLRLAGSIFGTDSVLYGSSTSVDDLLKRPKEATSTPSVGTMLACLGTIVPAFIVAGGVSNRLGVTSADTRLMISGGLTLALFLLLPSAFAAFCRSRFVTTFATEVPPATGLLGSVILGCGLWALAYELHVLVTPADRIQEILEQFSGIAAQIESSSVVIRLLCLALVPAVCEEWCFRGMVFSTLQKHGSTAKALFVSSFLFGALHIVVQNDPFMERFFPTFALGLALGLVRARTGSIWPGMVLHVLNNGIVLLLPEFRTQLASWGLNVDDRTHLPVSWLVGTVLFAIAGAALVWISGRRPGTSSAAAPVVSAD